MNFKETKVILNQLVADLSQASALIHQCHWYLRGPRFLTLHALMDTYRDQIEAQLDVIAERLITIDGSPISTLEEFIAHTQIKSTDASWTLSTEEHEQRIIVIFEALVTTYAKGIEAAGQEGDDVTQDIFIGFRAELEKNIWILKADIGQAPGIDA